MHHSSPSVVPPAFLAPLPPRDTLLVAGADALKFIDGFQTAAVSGLASGAGTEAFFTDGRGHVIALANILRLGDVEESGARLWIDLPAGMAGRLRDHVEHYHIREDVEFRDVSADRAGLLIGGPDAAAWLAAGAGAGPRPSFTPPERPLDHAAVRLGDVAVRLMRSDWFAVGGFHVFCNATDRPHLEGRLHAAGLPRVDESVLREHRIRAANPEPADIPEKALPQELGRGAGAISFTKGCYLGQETVARLDALGHVNRRLVPVAIAGAPPELPATIVQMPAGDVVGTVTSVCRATGSGDALGLALVHVKALPPAAAPEATWAVAGRPARPLVAPLSEASA